MAAKRLRATATCETCRDTFHPFPSSVGRFCSRECYFTTENGMGAIPGHRAGRCGGTCDMCGASFQTLRGVRRFCSRVCQGRGQSGPNNNSWTGGRQVTRSGYVLVWLPSEERDLHRHKLTAGRYMYEHVLKAEQAMGRCLRKGEVVHHVNFDKSDNRNTNLVVCDDGYHKRLHWEMSRRYAKEHFPAKVA